MTHKVYLTLLFLLFALAGYAQNEASTWYLGNGYGLRFDKGEAEIINEGPANNSTTYTYSNHAGQVQLYANKQGIFNKNGILLQNGGWTSNAVFIREIYIIPKPGSKTLFYVFYVNYVKPDLYSAANYAVMYSLVDITANGGAGAVIEKDKIIYNDLHGYFTVTGLCENNTYWLLGETNTNITGINTDQFLAYKITAGGIASEPVRSAPVYIGNSSGLKFSPKGDKLVFSYNAGPPPDNELLAVADFNVETGIVSNVIALEERGWQTAFSASGNKLYLSGLMSGPNKAPEKIWQFDISSGDSLEILASKSLVYDGPEKFQFSQLAPDGKIYLTQPDNKKALGVIRYPERPGIACEVIPNAFLFPEEFNGPLPVFPASSLYAYSVKVDAGPDREVCQGQQVQLGGVNDNNYTYYWEPADHLSNPNSPNTTFRYPHPITEKLELTYTLYVNDGTCMRADGVLVTVLPTPEQAPVKGSQSVCPGVEGVDYSTVAQEGYTYRWAVSGGQLVSGQGTAAIKVNWGPSNPNASVMVTAINAYGCESGKAVLPVRINVELKPEMPQGPAPVCLNQSAGNTYSVTNTNGSVYTWGIKGGTIVSGQGSNRVNVDWEGIGNHKLWIQEQSTTVDTVCFGISDTLQVNVFKDQTAISINYVTISDEAGSASEQEWQVNGTLTTAEGITVLRRTTGTETWTKVDEMPNTALSYHDPGLKGREEIYEYKLLTTNDCHEEIESMVHRTIRLTGNADHEQDAINLSWSSYRGWELGVEYYEIWRKIDDEPAYKLLQTVDGNTWQLSELDARAGFTHHYRIRAKAAEADWLSWSNSVTFTFEHDLFIPNIFTPNGDGFNDTFFIRKLELYPENEMVIVNRLGNEVYRKKGYQGTWNGGNVVTGVYYYQLYIKKLNKTFKGWVEILK